MDFTIKCSSRPLLMFLLVLAIGCGTKSGGPPTPTPTPTPTSTPANASGDDQSDPQAFELNFDSLLVLVDGVAGRRFQEMKMEAMRSVSYQYDGPVEKVFDIVGPWAKSTGFKEFHDAPNLDESEPGKEMQAAMGIKMTEVDSRVFMHPNGKSLTVHLVEMSGEGMGMSLLTVQLMDSSKMAELGAAAMGK